MQWLQRYQVMVVSFSEKMLGKNINHTGTYASIKIERERNLTTLE